MSLRFAFGFAAAPAARLDPTGSLLPVGLLSMAAVLRRDGHAVRVFHLARYGKGDALRLLLDGAPDVVGLSCFTFQRARTLELARRLRQAREGARPLVILGGPHAGALAAEILARCAWVDGVVEGEGEETIRDLARRLESGGGLEGVAGLWARSASGEVVQPPPRAPIAGLDALPSIARSDFAMLGVDPQHQHRHVITARGCTAGCVFCCAPRLWGGCVRGHSVARIMDEVDALRENKGLAYLSFRDDTFTTDPDWTRAFCRALLDRGSDLMWDCQSRVNRLDGGTLELMRRAGCTQIQLGVESASDSVLRTLRKPFTVAQVREVMRGAREVGMGMSWYLMAGVPGQTDEDIACTERLVRELRPGSLVVSHLARYPGTPLASEFDPARWFEDDRESLYVREDPQALAHERRLLALAGRTAASEPYTAQELEAAARRLADAPPALIALGRLHERQGRPEQAEAVYTRVLQSRPGHVWAQLELGVLHLEHGRPERAAELLGAVAEAVPSWPYPCDRYGWALLFQGRKTEGRAHIERARALGVLAPIEPPLIARRSLKEETGLDHQPGAR